ncbi:hypothetical protein AVEN_214353-1 [Araneus ventricosus]|uniref:Lipase domain-containing protein n=1 Tax=Araneus ventricosus TaxID=182803 RepID=A0A4Y2MHN5_ARAVE|nr:hypothetical protein AVEN_214353-1 [Araneus ventricosus]
MICSHMRATHLFTDTINGHHCQVIGYRCGSWEAFTRGECDSCGRAGEDCALMGYHMDTMRDYGNFSMFYMLTADRQPYCGQLHPNFSLFVFSSLIWVPKLEPMQQLSCSRN